MGVKESTGEKGLFPANFTRPIWKFTWKALNNVSQKTISSFFYKTKKKFIENIYIHVIRVSFKFLNYLYYLLNL